MTVRKGSAVRTEVASHDCGVPAPGDRRRPTAPFSSATTRSRSTSAGKTGASLALIISDSKPTDWRLVVALAHRGHRLAPSPLARTGLTEVLGSASGTAANRSPSACPTARIFSPGESRDLPIPSHAHARQEDPPGRGARDGFRRPAQRAARGHRSPPGAFDNLATRMGDHVTCSRSEGATTPAGMIRWLRAAMEVLQAAANVLRLLREGRAGRRRDGRARLGQRPGLLKDDEWIVEAQQVSPRLASVPEGAGRAATSSTRIRQRAKTLWDKPEANARDEPPPASSRSPP